MLPELYYENCCTLIYDLFGSFKHLILFVFFMAMGTLSVALIKCFSLYDLYAVTGRLRGIALTSMHSLECWMGLRKKVPSTNGYRSYTNMTSLHRMQFMWVFLWAASDDKTNIRVSSFPCLPSSSICVGKEKSRNEMLKSLFIKGERKITKNCNDVEKFEKVSVLLFIFTTRRWTS